jgi:3-methylcrotonyl-CoA carboxylase beta subunit
MTILPTHADRGGDLFAARSEEMEGLIALLTERRALIAAGGSEAAREKHRGRGKLLARERIDRLVDPDGAFLELGALAAWEQYDGVVPSAGIVTGIGVVQGRPCVIVANDATVKGGTYYPLTVKKHLRAQEVALENRLPCIYLVDSGCRCRPTSSPTATTSAASSTTRPACRRRASPRLPR